MNEEARRLLEFERMKEVFLPHLSSALGKRALAALTPSDDPDVIQRRGSLVAEVMSVVDRGVRLPLGGCHDLGPLLETVRGRGGPLEADELGYVGETLECSRNLVLAVEDLQREHPGLELPGLRELVGRVPAFTLLTDRISDVVDERYRVRDEASPRLIEIRSRISTSRQKIDKKLASLIARKDVRSCLQESTPRLRSGRPVVAVKAERRGEMRGVLHDVSQSGATCFVEPADLVPDGNVLEDLLAQERREITRILWDLTVKVLDAEVSIRQALEALARVDLAVGCAGAAEEWGLVLPEINCSGVQKFRAARHPVLMLLSDAESVVPVDIRLGEDFHLLVITGPNTGGKTVALKTLGILVMMAQCGLPVPAEEAEICPVRDIFVDVGDEQSLEQSLSTFSSHIGRIARFLETADRNTLVLLDELGSGTDPAEGAALGRAILDYLHAGRVPSVVTTHLGDLKTYAYTNPGASNACVEFDVETLSPTYRLLIGQPGASNALTIADRLGLPPGVVSRARGLLSSGDRASEEVLRMAQEIRTEAERHLRFAEDQKSDSRAMKQRVEEELRDARDRRLHVEKEAEDEMESALGRLRRLVLEYGKELGNAPRPFGEKAREMVSRAEEEIRATPLVSRREEFAKNLKRGDEVFVPKFEKRFQVHAVKKKARTLVLLRGSLRVEVAFADVTWVE